MASGRYKLQYLASNTWYDSALESSDDPDDILRKATSYEADLKIPYRVFDTVDNICIMETPLNILKPIKWYPGKIIDVDTLDVKKGAAQMKMLHYDTFIPDDLIDSVPSTQHQSRPTILRQYSGRKFR